MSLRAHSKPRSSQMEFCEGSTLGRVPTMKFEDWDLADSKKFPHLKTENLMKQSKEGSVTTLEPQKWLCGVEKAGLLHLL